MSKKIIAILLVAAAVLAAGFYLYKTGHLNSYFNLGDSSESELEWQKLLVFEIKNPDLSPELVSLYQAKYQELKTQLEVNPDLFNSWLHFGVLKKTVKDYEGARDIWIYCGQIRPLNSASFANLADLYAYFLDEPKKAEEAIKKAIENDSEDYSYYLALAEIYRYKMPNGGDLYEQTMSVALQKFPDNVNLIGPLALYFRQTDQIEKAITYYEQLIRLNPENEMAKQDLAELKQKINQ